MIGLANAETKINIKPKPMIIKLIHAETTNPFVGFTLILCVRRLINAPAIGNNTHKKENIDIQFDIKLINEYKLSNLCVELFKSYPYVASSPKRDVNLAKL